MQITSDASQATVSQNRLAKIDVTCGSNIFRIPEEKTGN